MSGAFTGLIVNGQIGKVVSGIESAVVASFLEDARRQPLLLVTSSTALGSKRSEAKRRTELCVKIFGILRGDLKWGIERALDHLPGYLRKELDGIGWEPEAKRAIWAPAGSTR